MSAAVFGGPEDFQIPQWELESDPPPPGRCSDAVSGFLGAQEEKAQLLC